MNAEEIAARMLETVPECLDYRFCDYLGRASDLVTGAGGQLVSRQAIACLILQWEDKTGKKAKAE